MDPVLITILTTLGLYAAVVISPGPNFALISRLAVSGARRTAFGATFGLALAATFYAILSMTGLALLLTRVAWLAGFVQIVGGIYLIYLGVMAWHANGAATTTHQQVDAGSLTRGLRMGALVNLSNPKGIAFFIGLYAVAVPPETALWAKTIILCGGFMLEIVWYGLTVMLLSSRPARAAYEKFGRWIERSIGALLAAFGLKLIVEKLP
ncbi:LysE family transporter [Neorhizobium sp. JUb45]|uniref:LysE family translocator n=1 Tax=unclassified Neorhizobium TaxID=2629175 RepID=UPI001047B00A|nr:LysE family transporter [Neorhizobium sp. JUb45]TCQ99978.1 threonine/homoserine/homoserine lactone efflux protein [Neorhizobium sp. JUb45]